MAGGIIMGAFLLIRKAKGADVEEVEKSYNNSIDDLRKKYKSNKSEGYIKKTDHILDVMKYDIKDSSKKTSIMRAIERDMKEKDLAEIPDLYKYI